MPAYRLTHTDYHRIGVELKQMLKFFRGNVVVWIIAAPGQKRPGHTGFHRLSKKYVGAVLVQILQQAPGPGTLKIFQRLFKAIPHGFLRCNEKRVREVNLAGKPILLGQHGGEDAFLSRSVPNIGGKALLIAGSGIRQIKDIFQLRHCAGVVDQRNSRGSAIHDPVHPPVPKFNGRAGRCVPALRVDEQLLSKGVLVKPGRTGEELRPALHGVGQLQSRHFRQLRNYTVIVQSNHFYSLGFSFGRKRPQKGIFPENKIDGTSFGTVYLSMAI
ncbi:MAG: hypothetical protein VB096_04955 [Pseudoflavonifractor sp.]|nr:hypothetical protein [Pseudoflavonifractor sp.]